MTAHRDSMLHLSHLGFEDFQVSQNNATPCCVSGLITSCRADLDHVNVWGLKEREVFVVVIVA